MWHEAVPAGTERYLTRFLVRPEYGLSWRERDQQTLANQGTNSGTHPGEVPAARLKAEAHLCTAAHAGRLTLAMREVLLGRGHLPVRESASI